MQEQAVVRVVRQPDNQFVQLVGEVGFVDEIREGGRLCNLQTMHIDGRPSGSATVPIDCLAVESDPAWLRAYEKIQDGFKRHEQAILTYSANINQTIEMLAKEHGLTREAVESIYKTLRPVYDDRSMFPAV